MPDPAVRRTTEDGVIERRCTRCHEFKPESVEAFAVKRRRKTDGVAVFYGRCRVCESKRITTYQREQYASNPHWRERRKRVKRRADEPHRIDTRIRREQEGRPMPVKDARSPDESVFPRLPVRPLVRAIEALIAREDRELSHHDPMRRLVREAMTSVCARFDLPERTFTAWRIGERDLADFDLVDKILVRAGWLWWEVYEAKTVRLPILVVHMREHRIDRDHPRGYWLSKRRIHYGDAGPDLAALALVEQAFTGECDVDVTPPHKRPGYQPPKTVEEYREAAKAGQWRPWHPGGKRAREARAA